MSVIMLAPYAAPPSSQERISFYQVKVLDANETQLGWINTDAMAIALQEFGFAVLDTRKEKGLTFGQAYFMMKHGHKVRRAVDPEDKYFVITSGKLVCWRGDWDTQQQMVSFDDIKATDWQLVKQ